MKKIDPSKIVITALFMSLVTSVAVSYAEAPPSVSSPFGDTAADSGSSDSDEAPPSLGGTTTTTPTTTTKTTPTTTTKTTPTTTTKTTPTTTTTTPTTTTPPPPAPTSSATNITPKKLSKTGPELAILVLPSLLAGYFIGKGKKK